MTYHVRDANGYLGDVASIGGWRECRPVLEAAGGLLSDFAREGVSDTPTLLADALEAILSVPEGIPTPGCREILESMLRTSKRAKLTYILSDGTDDSEDVELEEIEQAEEFASLGGEEGVWRTIRGRKVFIREGEDPADAIERSKGWVKGDPGLKSLLSRHGFNYEGRKEGISGRGVLFRKKTSNNEAMQDAYGKLTSDLKGEGYKKESGGGGSSWSRAWTMHSTWKARGHPVIELEGGFSRANIIDVLIQERTSKFEQEEEFSHLGKYAAVKRTLDTLEEKATEQFLDVIAEMREAVATKVKRAASSQALSGLAADLKLPLFGDFRNVLIEMMRRTHEAGRGDGLREVKERSSEFASSFTPRAALRWLRDKEINISGIFSTNLVNSIKNVLVNALKVGLGVNETVERVLDQFDPYLGKPSVLGPEGIPPAPHRLATMVRNVTTEAYNHGRLTEYMDPDLLPFMQGVRYSAILDDVTTEVCRFLHGKIFRMGDPDMLILSPGNHHNCRSIFVPVVVGETVEQRDFITPAQKGRAKGLADAKFLEQE